ncbi:hypothetical protein ABU162_01935 [Paenibacillus thiaminolyticus]|uniref:hypothetical protein n=1 Tax=Paenibacillus thiaminolyticus TaxID=49283 RepID=UPI0035A73424
MMKLPVALFNWLQIKIVTDARPEDGAAKETIAFFEDILREDHRLGSVAAQWDEAEDSYVVTYEQDGATHSERFDRDEAERLWKDIEANPKYNE